MKKHQKIFITGNGTDIGKTLISAILCQAWGADYWKPIQSGSLDNTDSDVVRGLLTNPNCKIHPEQYRLNAFMSPHAAAQIDQIELKIENIKLPQTENLLLIEGAGGLCVPLNDQELIIDLIQKLDTSVVFVAKNYLGSINHTLLSIEALRQRNISILGLIFNGPEVFSTQDFIAQYTKLKVLGHIPEVQNLGQEVVKQLAEQFIKFKELNL